jgi:hypothetical protein
VNGKSLLAAKRRAMRQDREDGATKSSVRNMLVVDVSETSVKILATGKVSFAAGRLRNLITWDALEIGCMRWRRSIIPGPVLQRA